MKLKHDVRVLEMITDSRRETISCKDEPFLANCDTLWERNNLAPNTRYAVLLVPIPDGHRLAGASEKPQSALNSIRGDMRVGKTNMHFPSSGQNIGLVDAIGIVSIKSERDVKHEALQAQLKEAEALVAEVRKAMVEQ